MKFNIVENHIDEYPMEDIIKDYVAKELTIIEIRKKYDISSVKWSRDVFRKIKESGVKLRNNNQTKNTQKQFKFYSYCNGRYNVQRIVDGKYYRFGGYDTEEEAQKRVQELNENNWNGLIE